MSDPSERHTRDGRRSATELTPRSPRLLFLDQPRQTRLCSEPGQRDRFHRRANRRTVAGTGTRSRACLCDETDGQMRRSQRHEFPNERPRDHERAIVPVGRAVRLITPAARTNHGDPPPPLAGDSPSFARKPRRRTRLSSSEGRRGSGPHYLVRATYLDLKKSALFAPDLYYLDVDGGYSALK